MIDLATHAFILLFVVIDPISLAPMFAALTRGESEAYRSRTAIRGVVIAGVILIVFTLSGAYLLRYLNINTASFSIAGGILLFLLAMDMVLVRHTGLRLTTLREQEEALHKTDISVFPLGIPMIAGPGALTTILLLRDAPVLSLHTLILVCVLIVVLALALIMLLLAAKITGLLGETGANVITRVLGVLLTALAVQFILNGLSATFPALAGQMTS